MAYYTGLDGVHSDTESHLGGNIREGDPFTFAPKTWQYLIDRFAVSSILDLGAGLGYASAYFHSLGKKVISVDGMTHNCDNAIYPTIKFDLETGPVRCVVDLVHCQEVVEHIEEKFLDNLLTSMTCGKIIVMTHAVPGQGGYHHVNEKPAEYWIEHLKRFHCTLLEEDSNRVRKLATEDGAIFLAATGMVFSNSRAR